jgi:lipoate-protein ligase A
LFVDEAHDGAWNMAVDETLLESAGDGQATLRFYGWKPHCLSLGRLQRQLPPAALETNREFDVVRRPTGGRAVWHAHEITYSFAAPLEMLPSDSRGVQSSYEWLSAGFARGLQELGVDAQLSPRAVSAAQSRESGPNCFALTANCDLVARGKKLIGAAQCRSERAWLQHGSLLLSMDRAQWTHHAGGSMDGAISLQELGLELAPSRVVEALYKALGEVTGHTLQAGALTGEEMKRAQELRESKYNCETWTYKARAGESESVSGAANFAKKL